MSGILHVWKKDDQSAWEVTPMPQSCLSRLPCYWRASGRRGRSDGGVVCNRLRPGNPAAPRRDSLVLLPSGPDTVRRSCRAGPSPSLLHTTSGAGVARQEFTRRRCDCQSPCNGRATAVLCRVYWRSWQGEAEACPTARRWFHADIPAQTGYDPPHDGQPQSVALRPHALYPRKRLE